MSLTWLSCQQVQNVTYTTQAPELQSYVFFPKYVLLSEKLHIVTKDGSLSSTEDATIHPLFTHSHFSDLNK